MLTSIWLGGFAFWLRCWLVLSFGRAPARNSTLTGRIHPVVGDPCRVFGFGLMRFSKGFDGFRVRAVLVRV